MFLIFILHCTNNSYLILHIIKNGYQHLKWRVKTIINKCVQYIYFTLYTFLMDLCIK